MSELEYFVISCIEAKNTNFQHGGGVLQGASLWGHCPPLWVPYPTSYLSFIPLIIISFLPLIMIVFLVTLVGQVTQWVISMLNIG